MIHQDADTAAPPVALIRPFLANVGMQQRLFPRLLTLSSVFSHLHAEGNLMLTATQIRGIAILTYFILSNRSKDESLRQLLGSTREGGVRL